MEENLKNGVIIMPKAIVDLVEKAEKTSADCKAIYDYLVAYKEAKKTFEMRKGDKVAFITKVEYLSDEVKTELFSVTEDEFEEAPSVESIVEELADKQDKLTAGDGITISNDDVISVDGDLVPAVSGDDKDKYLHTNASTGDLEWTEVSAGGGNFVEVTYSSSMTITELATALGLTLNSNTNGARTFILIQYNSKELCRFEYQYYGSFSAKFVQYTHDVNEELVTFSMAKISDPSTTLNSLNFKSYFAMPPIIDLGATKTYVMKCVNRSLQWVEEQA